MYTGPTTICGIEDKDPNIGSLVVKEKITTRKNTIYFYLTNNFLKLAAHRASLEASTTI